jgi:hypothetical protein
VSSNAKAELAPGLSHVDLLHTGRRKELERLDKAAKHNRQQGHGDDDSRARSPASAEGQEPEVVSRGFDVAIQKPLRHEFLRLVPEFWVVADPPRIHKDLALGGDVVASELGVVDVHVRDKERNGHVEAHHLLHKRRQVWELVVVGIRLAHQVALSKNGVKFFADSPLDLRVVNKLRNSPLN